MCFWELVTGADLRILWNYPSIILASMGSLSSERGWNSHPHLFCAWNSQVIQLSFARLPSLDLLHNYCFWVLLLFRVIHRILPSITDTSPQPTFLKTWGKQKWSIYTNGIFSVSQHNPFIGCIKTHYPRREISWDTASVIVTWVLPAGCPHWSRYHPYPAMDVPQKGIVRLHLV